MPRLAWRLEYEKSTVFFAFDVGGDMSGKGDIFAVPRAGGKLARVGNFDAKRVSKEWSLLDPVVARRVTDTMPGERADKLPKILQ